MQHELPDVDVAAEMAAKALLPIERMLDLS